MFKSEPIHGHPARRFKRLPISGLGEDGTHAEVSTIWHKCRSVALDDRPAPADEGPQGWRPSARRGDIGD